MSGYIGNIPTPQATQTRDTFTATAGQTTFATSGYTPSFLDVFLNGVHLVNGTDYTATNGSDVVLTSGAAAGDTLEVVSYSTFEVNSQTFTGTTTLTGDLQATTATFSGAVTGTDATLSGGVYLGGTGAANYLDDYETGTWTPTNNGAAVTFTVIDAKYTKVGRLVTVNMFATSVSTSITTQTTIGGLPFPVVSGSYFIAPLNHNSGTAGQSFARAQPATNTLVGLTLNNSPVDWILYNGSFLLTSVSYFTDA